MQAATRCINISKTLRANSLRNFNTLTYKINNGFNGVKLLFPVATKLLNRRKLIIRPESGVHSCYSTINSPEHQLVDAVKFEKVCEETLESLSEYFEELVEKAEHLKSPDVNYSSGVLTVNFGQPYGTYVINRQTPNRQIWLSSPTSGPKRYDFVVEGGYWLYKHDGKTLHQLLQAEIPKIVASEVDFSKCSHSYCE